jgi:NADPH:quinone reductase-like Zn-dependent oxidoreductase
VVIQGSGPLGNFATAVAKDHGAKKVLVIGAPANRLEVTKKMGADAVLNLEEVADEKQRRQWVKDHTDGRGADIVIQVANNMAVPEGLTLLRDGGRYLNIGAGGKANIAVENISLRGNDQQKLQARSNQRSHGSDGELLGGQGGD